MTDPGAGARRFRGEGRGPVVAAGLGLAAAAVLVLALTSDREDAHDDASWLPVASATSSTTSTSTSTSTSTPVASQPGPARVAQPPPSDRGAPSPAPASAVPAGPAGAWRLRALSDGPAQGALNDVTTVELGDRQVLLTAGSDGERPLVVVSGDGERWDPLTQAGLGGSGAARSVSADGDRVVIAGRDDRGPAVWELRGSDAWKRLEIEGAGDADIVLSSVAVFGDLTIAVGFDSGGSGLWFSEGEGAPLARARLDAVEEAVAGDTIVRDVVAGDRLVAVGRAGERPVRWTSTDGRRWRALVLEDPDGGGTPVVLSGDGAVVAGHDAVGGVAWRIDGSAQQRWRLPEPTDRPQTVHALAWSGTSVLLLGRDGGEPRCWSGSLGSPEDPLAGCPGTGAAPPGAVLLGLTVWGDSIVGVGAHGSPAARPGVWIRPAEVADG